MRRAARPFVRVASSLALLGGRSHHADALVRTPVLVASRARSLHGLVGVPCARPSSFSPAATSGRVVLTNTAFRAVLSLASNSAARPTSGYAQFRVRPITR